MFRMAVLMRQDRYLVGKTPVANVANYCNFTVYLYESTHNTFILPYVSLIPQHQRQSTLTLIYKFCNASNKHFSTFFSFCLLSLVFLPLPPSLSASLSALLPSSPPSLPPSLLSFLPFLLLNVSAKPSYIF